MNVEYYDEVFNVTIDDPDVFFDLVDIPRAEVEEIFRKHKSKMGRVAMSREGFQDITLLRKSVFAERASKISPEEARDYKSLYNEIKLMDFEKIKKKHNVKLDLQTPYEYQGWNDEDTLDWNENLSNWNENFHQWSINFGL